MTTLQVLAQAIRDGLDNMTMNFLPTGSSCTFKQFIGDLSATGVHSLDDEIPAGLFIWLEENFIGSPDTIFTDYKENQKIAFYIL